MKNYVLRDDDDLFARPPRTLIQQQHSDPPVSRQSCAVCGLRADCLICKECALDVEAAIKWLERLPPGERITKALELLRTL